MQRRGVEQELHHRIREAELQIDQRYEQFKQKLVLLDTAFRMCAQMCGATDTASRSLGELQVDIENWARRTGFEVSRLRLDAVRHLASTQLTDEDDDIDGRDDEPDVHIRIIERRARTAEQLLNGLKSSFSSILEKHSERLRAEHVLSQCADVCSIITRGADKRITAERGVLTLLGGQSLRGYGDAVSAHARTLQELLTLKKGNESVDLISTWGLSNEERDTLERTVGTLAEHLKQTTEGAAHTFSVDGVPWSESFLIQTERFFNALHERLNRIAKLKALSGELAETITYLIRSEGFGGNAGGKPQLQDYINDDDAEAFIKRMDALGLSDARRAFIDACTLEWLVRRWVFQDTTSTHATYESIDTDDIQRQLENAREQMADLKFRYIEKKFPEGGTGYTREQRRIDEAHIREMTDAVRGLASTPGLTLTQEVSQMLGAVYQSVERALDTTHTDAHALSSARGALVSARTTLEDLIRALPTPHKDVHGDTTTRETVSSDTLSHQHHALRQEVTRTRVRNRVRNAVSAIMGGLLGMTVTIPEQPRREPMHDVGARPQLPDADTIPKPQTVDDTDMSERAPALKVNPERERLFKQFKTPVTSEHGTYALLPVLRTYVGAHGLRTPDERRALDWFTHAFARYINEAPEVRIAQLTQGVQLPRGVIASTIPARVHGARVELSYGEILSDETFWKWFDEFFAKRKAGSLNQPGLVGLTESVESLSARLRKEFVGTP